jgi:hypothetical protein
METEHWFSKVMASLHKCTAFAYRNEKAVHLGHV